MNTKVFIISLIIFCLLFANFVSLNVHSELEEDHLVQGWSMDIELTYKDDVDSICPNVITDSKNIIHTTWSDHRDGSWVVYYKRYTSDENTWSLDTRLTSPSHVAGAPVFGRSTNDTLFIVYPQDVNMQTTNFDIYYLKSIDYGATWTAPTRITYTTNISTCPAIYISRDNIIHLVWNERVNNEQYEIYYTQSNDFGATWSPLERVTNNLNESMYPSMVVDSSEIVHVVWQEEGDNNLYTVWYGRRLDKNSWKIAQLTPPSYSYREPKIAINSNNNLYVIWTDYRSGPRGEIFFKKSTNQGSGWSKDMNLTESPLNGDFMPYLTVDSNDYIHVVWKSSIGEENETGFHYTANDLCYTRSKDGGNTWDTPVRLTYAVEGTRMHPKIVADKNNFLHIVWYDQRSDEDENMEIYYKRTLKSVPSIFLTAVLSVDHCKPNENITVSGNVSYNNTPLSNTQVTIRILETNDGWTTVTDSNGNYSKPIIAPDTPGNYTIRVTVTSGNYTGYKQMRLTVEQESTNGGTANGGQQPDGEENKYGINLNYVIGIVVIAVCIIIGVVLVKRIGKTTAKTAKEKVEKTTINLRCPKCKKTFRVEVKPKPFNVKCPYCGKEGTIK